MSSLAKLSARMTVTGGLTVVKQYRLKKLYSLLELRTRQIRRSKPVGPYTLAIGTKLMNTATAVGLTAINGVTLSA